MVLATQHTAHSIIYDWLYDDIFHLTSICAHLFRMARHSGALGTGHTRRHTCWLPLPDRGQFIGPYGTRQCGALSKAELIPGSANQRCAPRGETFPPAHAARFPQSVLGNQLVKCFQLGFIHCELMPPQ